MGDFHTFAMGPPKLVEVSVSQGPAWQVLLEDPKEKGIDLYDEMKKFYAWHLK